MKKFLGHIYSSMSVCYDCMYVCICIILSAPIHFVIFCTTIEMQIVLWVFMCSYVYLKEWNFHFATIKTWSILKFCNERNLMQIINSLIGKVYGKSVDLLIASSASRSLAKRTTPQSCPLISANFTSPHERNSSRNVCHVQFGGSYIWSEEMKGIFDFGLVFHGKILNGCLGKMMTIYST